MSSIPSVPPFKPQSPPPAYSSQEGDLAEKTSPIEEQPALTQAEKMAKLQELYEQLQKLAEDHEGISNDDAVPTEPPQLDLSKLNIPLNSVYDENFDPFKRVLNLAQLMFSPAMKYQVLYPTVGAIATLSSLSISHGIPAATGIAGVAGSLYFLNHSFQNLSKLSISDQGMGKTALKTLMIIGPAILSGYGALSSLGLLSTVTGAERAIGMLSAASSLYLAMPPTEPAEEKNSSWGLSSMLSVAKTALASYGIIGGLSAIVRCEEMIPGMTTLINWATNATGLAGHGTGILQAIAGENRLTQSISTVVSAYLFLGASMAISQLMAGTYGKMSEELMGVFDDMKYSGEYDRLCSIGQEQYHQEIEEMTGYKFDEIKEAFEPLRSKEPVYPENAAKPIVAKLIVITKELGENFNEYAKLKNESKLKELDEFLAKELKPKLIKLFYLKHCLLNPMRPQLGQLSPDGKEYFSYTSHLTGEPVKRTIEEVDPGEIIARANEILSEEESIQRDYLHQLAQYRMEQEIIAQAKAQATG